MLLTIAALSTLLCGCQLGPVPERGATMLAERINKGDLAGVEAALAAGANPNEKDDRGNPVLVLATATDRYQMANLLLDKGADFYATDDFGLLPGALASQSRVLPDSVEGKALATFITALKLRGHPWPPPGPKEVQRLKATGHWPPRPSEEH